MIGAIAGDIIGSVYEFHNINITEFLLFDPRCTFTDDTVLTVAVPDVILTGADYTAKYKEYFRAYPGRGYGAGFRKWVTADNQPSRIQLGERLSDARQSRRVRLRYP